MIIAHVACDGSFSAINVHPKSQTVDLGKSTSSGHEEGDGTEHPTLLGTGLIWDEVYAKLVVRCSLGLRQPGSADLLFPCLFLGRFLVLIERSLGWMISRWELTSSEVVLPVSAFYDSVIRDCCSTNQHTCIARQVLAFPVWYSVEVSWSRNTIWGSSSVIRCYNRILMAH